jgi:hypothetical protein
VKPQPIIFGVSRLLMPSDVLKSGGSVSNDFQNGQSDCNAFNAAQLHEYSQANDDKIGRMCNLAYMGRF